MDITHTTVPGGGTVHHCTARNGQQFGVPVGHTSRRALLIYNTDDREAP